MENEGYIVEMRVMSVKRRMIPSSIPTSSGRQKWSGDGQ